MDLADVGKGVTLEPGAGATSFGATVIGMGIGFGLVAEAVLSCGAGLRAAGGAGSRFAAGSWAAACFAGAVC